jgi:biotin carboxyl carrier protein
MSTPGITTADRIDTESDMLPQEPPPWVIRFAARLMIGLFVVALLAAIIVKLPETVNCAFILVPKEGADPIQSPRVAVMHRIGVTEGQTINQGTEMFVLRSDEIRGPRRAASKHAGRSTHAGTRHGESRCRLRVADGHQASGDLAGGERGEVPRKARDHESRARRTHGEAFESRRDLWRRVDPPAALKQPNPKRIHSVAERTLQQVRLEQKRMETEHSRRRSEKLAEIEKLKYKLAAFKGDLENSEQDLLSIRAPYDAVVISLAQRSSGSVVQNGQELCQLARADAQPHARLTIKETGLPRLSVGTTGAVLLRCVSVSTLRGGRREGGLD